MSHVTILIPLYNAAAYIDEAISSVLDQEFDGEVEVIVVDDGSTDGSGDRVVALWESDPRVTLVRQENRGVAATRNALLGLVPEHADFVSFLDSDDAYPAGRISHDLEVLQNDSDLPIVYGALRLVADADQPLRDACTETDIVVRGISMSTGTFRREALLQTGLFDETFGIGEDLDFLLRFFEQNANRNLHSYASTLYRQHPENMTNDSSSLQRGVMRAMLGHAKRRKAQPDLASVEGVFNVAGPVDTNLELGAYSVVIPAFNAAPFISETIASVAAQDPAPETIIVVDDGSADDTAKIAAASSDLVRVIRQENSGPGAAMTRGIEEVTTECLATIDADDIWNPGKMHRQLSILAIDQKIDACFTRLKSFSEDDSLKVDDAISGWSRSSLVGRTDSLREIGPVVDTEDRIGEMVDWLAKGRELGKRFFLIDDFFVRRRLHAASLTARAAKTDQRAYMEAALRAIKRRKSP